MQFKVFNFIFYMIIAVLSYLNIYFKDIGLSSTQIGALNSVAKGVALLILPFWGILSDYYQANKKLLKIAILGMLLFSFTFLLTDDFIILIFIMIAFHIFWTPIVPLVDAQLLSYLGSRGNQYGRYRIWGSLSFTLVVPVIGYFLEETNPYNLFYIIGFILLLTFLASFKLPDNNAEIKVGSLEDFKKLLSNKSLLGFIIFLFFISITRMINMVYFPIYLVDNGGGEFLVGVALMISASSEMIIFYLSEKITTRFKGKTLFLVSSLAAALRWFVLASFAVPAVILSSQLLHSLTFGLFHLTSVDFINKISGEKFKATGQNLYATTNGISAITGSFIGGLIYDTAGGSSLYFYLSIIAFTTGMIYFLILSRNERIRYNKSHN